MSTESDNALGLKLLLADIRDVFAKEGSVARGAEISSADMVKALVAIEGRPWAERGKNGKRGNPLTQTKLAQMLKPLAIASDHIGSVRGFKLWQFEEAFSRYLPLERGLSSRRVQELAEWYSHQAYWHYSPNALAAGALDADLRAILRKEMSPWHVEIEFERVLTASRLSAFHIGNLSTHVKLATIQQPVQACSPQASKNVLSSYPTPYPSCERVPVRIHAHSHDNPPRLPLPAP